MKCPACGFEFEKDRAEGQAQPAPKQEPKQQVITQSAFEKMNGKEATAFLNAGGRVSGGS